MIVVINKNKYFHDIKTMCNVLGVARSTYYRSLNKTDSKRYKENEELKIEINKIYDDNKGIYGAPKIHHILNQGNLYGIFKKAPSCCIFSSFRHKNDPLKVDRFLLFNLSTLRGSYQYILV
ncbi:IS3 family transposase [Clostridium gasigenes]|uniref:HTH-like domain-containing protein n=1 Tax=Clostridium gasigenes TaxID=94869 RepID=A0A7X0VQV5_9CLOT|nr:IS3 family transposase [Clostridium gasigenes]MBB6714767.1 hypothetical protein [Clostridium gasigenes]